MREKEKGNSSKGSNRECVKRVGERRREMRSRREKMERAWNDV